MREAPQHLTEGGWCQVLANWAIERAPLGRAAGRLAGYRLRCAGRPARVVDPAAYVELWLKDSGHHGGDDYWERYDTWLAWFEEQGIEGIGFGWVNLRLGGSTIASWTGPTASSSRSPPIAKWRAAIGVEVGFDATLLARADLVQETGADGRRTPRDDRDPPAARLPPGPTADTVVAGLVGACDGELSVGQILAALADLLKLDPEDARTTYIPVVRELVEDGFLRTAG